MELSLRNGIRRSTGFSSAERFSFNTPEQLAAAYKTRLLELGELVKRHAQKGPEIIVDPYDKFDETTCYSKTTTWQLPDVDINGKKHTLLFQTVRYADVQEADLPDAKAWYTQYIDNACEAGYEVTHRYLVVDESGNERAKGFADEHTTETSITENFVTDREMCVIEFEDFMEFYQGLQQDLLLVEA